LAVDQQGVLTGCSDSRAIYVKGWIGKDNFIGCLKVGVCDEPGGIVAADTYRPGRNELAGVESILCPAKVDRTCCRGGIGVEEVDISPRNAFGSYGIRYRDICIRDGDQVGRVVGRIGRLPDYGDCSSSLDDDTFCIRPGFNSNRLPTIALRVLEGCVDGRELAGTV
jgi:hypothetical protein